MASKRRGGFRPPELRGTLGTLLRTTTGVVRDALERGAREGRARLDVARANRRRHDALADLGELVLDLIRRGEIDLAELPEARDLVRELDDLDEADAAVFDDNRDGLGSAAAARDAPRAATRSRFDDRARSGDGRASRDDDRASRGGSRGSSGDDGARGGGSRGRSDGRPRRDIDDGTVSSGVTSRADRPTVLARPRHANDSRRRPADDDSPRRDHDDEPRSFGDEARSDAMDGSASSTATSRRDRPTVAERGRNVETDSTRAPTRPMKGIWRPRIEDAPLVPDSRDRFRRAEGTSPPAQLARDASEQANQTNRDDVDGQVAAVEPDRSSADRDRPDHDTVRDPVERHARDTEVDQADRSDRIDHRSFSRDPTRKGGISFDDDDLADYMHPDDVPPKNPPKDPEDRGA